MAGVNKAQCKECPYRPDWRETEESVVPKCEEKTMQYFYCGSCQYPLQLGDRYCKKCGRRVNWRG